MHFAHIVANRENFEGLLSLFQNFINDPCGLPGSFREPNQRSAHKAST
jgi:hypothetical protein